MPTKALAADEIELIQETLDKCDGGIRATHRDLKDRGYDLSYGSVQNVAAGYRGYKAADFDEPMARSELIHNLRRRWVGVAQLAKKLGCAERDVQGALSRLEDAGYVIERDGNRARIEKGISVGAEKLRNKVPLNGKAGGFGVLSDTHLASHYQRLDVLEDAYNAFAKAKIKTVLHCGNIVDGEMQYNKHELYAHGVTDQTLYCLDHYPQRAGIVTRFITGDCHEGNWLKREGINFGRYLMHEAQSRGRTDLVYEGHQEIDLPIDDPENREIVRLFHPSRGTSYALSYRVQKIIESLQGGEKPAMILVGHFHKLEYLMVRNVHALQTGCIQDQTRFMRGIPTEAHIGFWIVRYQQDAKGAIRSLTPKVETFFDRSYHLTEHGVLL